MAKKLTYKQDKFVKKYIENEGNASKAAQEVYNCENNATARSIGSENLTKPNIRQSIEEACKKHGFGAKKVMEEIIEGIQKHNKDHTKYIALAKDILGMDAAKESKIDTTISDNTQEKQDILKYLQNNRLN